MEQGSNEWLEWRKHGIGASESAALLGLFPYKTAFKLWKEKRGAGVEDSEAMPGLFQRGHETEAMVRAEIELDLGVDYAPALFEHPEFPFIRASLDGWAPTGQPQGLEIKMVGREAMAGPIPPHHQVQLQHQMLVTATDEWLYARHCEGVTQRMVVKADKAMQVRILSACWDFWAKVQDGTMPAFQERDYIPVEDANLDLALKNMQAESTTTKRAPWRAEALRPAGKLRLGNKLENMVAGSAHGAKVTLDPPRGTFPRAKD